MDFFVTPTINFEIYLKSKGSMFRVSKEMKTIPVIDGEKLTLKKLNDEKYREAISAYMEIIHPDEQIKMTLTNIK